MLESCVDAGLKKIAALGAAGSIINAVSDGRPLGEQFREQLERHFPSTKVETDAKARAADGSNVVYLSASAYNLKSAELAELDVNLDSLLKSPGLVPDTPFHERHSRVSDPGVLDTMREIDKTLGGGVRWPPVIVTPGLNRGVKPALAVYRWNGETGDRSIHLDQDWVYQEHRTGQASGKSVRQVLVHELQHSVTHEWTAELSAAADASGAPYPRRVAFSEGRADMAKVLYAELDQRAGAPGPRLNRLEPEQRREAVREILSQHLTPIDRSDRYGGELADERLYEAVRESAYIGGGHRVWDDVNDGRTVSYFQGVDGSSQVHVFVPTRDLTGGLSGDRYREVAISLDELARKSTERRRELQAERAAAGSPPGRVPAAAVAVTRPLPPAYGGGGERSAPFAGERRQVRGGDVAACRVAARLLADKRAPTVPAAVRGAVSARPPAGLVGRLRAAWSGVRGGGLAAEVVSEPGSVKQRGSARAGRGDSPHMALGEGSALVPARHASAVAVRPVSAVRALARASRASRSHVQR